MRPLLPLLVAAALLALVAPGAVDAGLRRELLGYSHEGRPIKAYRLGDPASENVVLVVGCIHGNECAGTKVIAALKKRSPRRVKIWMIEALNPDGAAAGTRQNARGVDLNRNFPRKWQHQGTRWSTYYSGPRRASEKETRHAMRFVEEIRPDVTIWYHQAMSLVDRSGGRVAIQRRYARMVGLPLRRLDPPAGDGDALAEPSLRQLDVVRRRAPGRRASLALGQGTCPRGRDRREDVAARQAS